MTSLGVADDVIDHRLELCRLHVLHRGVFAVGHGVVSLKGTWLAAVLAAGPDAVLSHRSAAALWEIRGARRSSVDVTAPRRVRRPGSRGIAALRRILGNAGEIGRTVTRSELEIDLLALVDAHGSRGRGRTPRSADTRSTPSGPMTA